MKKLETKESQVGDRTEVGRTPPPPPRADLPVVAQQIVFPTTTMIALSEAAMFPNLKCRKYHTTTFTETNMVQWTRCEIRIAQSFLSLPSSGVGAARAEVLPTSRDASRFCSQPERWCDRHGRRPGNLDDRHCAVVRQT